MTYLTMLGALVLSAISAYFSVLGLSAIFAASQTEIIIMTGAMEAVKILTAVWLHLYWSKVNLIFRVYLSMAVLILMCITSMGVYGLLSKAYIEQQVRISTGVEQELKLVNLDLDKKKQELDEINKKLGLTEDPLNTYVTQSKTRQQANAALNKVSSLKKTLKEDQEIKKQVQQDLIDLEKKIIRLQADQKLETAEIGPVVYLAQNLYGNNSRDNVDRAVWWLIIILILVMDPLALILMMASSKVVADQKVEEEPDIPDVKFDEKANVRKNREMEPSEKHGGFVKIPKNSIITLK